MTTNNPLSLNHDYLLSMIHLLSGLGFDFSEPRIEKITELPDKKYLYSTFVVPIGPNKEEFNALLERLGMLYISNPSSDQWKTSIAVYELFAAFNSYGDTLIGSGGDFSDRERRWGCHVNSSFDAIHSVLLELYKTLKIFRHAFVHHWSEITIDATSLKVETPKKMRSLSLN